MVEDEEEEEKGKVDEEREEKDDGEKEEEKEEKETNFTRREYNYTNFMRSFNLPENIKAEKMDARYENGVLTLLLPKEVMAKVKPKAIEVH